MIGMSSGFMVDVLWFHRLTPGYGMVWRAHLAGTHCLRKMHGDGVKGRNGVVYGTRFGTLFIYIIPLEVFRQASEQRTLFANALPSAPGPGTTPTIHIYSKEHLKINKIYGHNARLSPSEGLGFMPKASSMAAWDRDGELFSAADESQM